MIFKVYYQPTKKISPRRENTQSLYLEAKDEIEARAKIEQNKDYNVELIEGLSDKALAYEQQSPDFKVVEFD